MSTIGTKEIIVEVKELSFEKDQLVADLLRFLAEQLPQIDITRNGNELEVKMPAKISKRALRLRLRKFLYQKGLYDQYRPISFKKVDIDGYTIKKKKAVELSYY